MNKHNVYGIAALLLCLAVYHAAALNGETTRIEDSAVYVILAEALAHGQGYANISFVGDPSNVHYPPLFPLLLTPLVSFFGRNFLLMKALVLLFAFASFLLIYVLVRGRAGEKKALLITAVIGISPAFFSYSHEVMSEMVYLCLSLLALHFLSRYNRESRWVTGSGVAALMFIALACLTRTIGFSLILTALLSLLLRKPAQEFKHRFLAAGILAGLCALPVLGWTLHGIALAQSSIQSPMQDHLGRRPLYADFFLAKDEFATDEGMVESLADLLPRLHHNLYAYEHGTAALLFPLRLPSGQNLVAAVVSLLLLLGFFSSLWQRREEAEMYVVFCGLALLLYPTAQVPRYLVPLFPFLLLYFVDGVEALTRVLRERLAKVVMASLAIMLLSANVVAATFYPPKTQRDLTDFREAAAWLKDHTVLGSVVMSRKPNLLYVGSDRKGARFPFTADAQRVVRAICAWRVNYVVQDSFSPVTERYLVPVIKQNKEIFSQVYSRHDTHIFAVHQTSGCGGMGYQGLQYPPGSDQNPDRSQPRDGWHRTKHGSMPNRLLVARHSIKNKRYS